MLSREGVVLAALLCLAAADAGAQAVAPPAVSASAVHAAASVVRADPLLPGLETTKVLRFKDKEKAKPAEQDEVRWWLDLIGNLSAGLRVAIWLVAAGLLIWLLLRLRDWLGRGSGGAALQALPPTHVGTLDIRPESLPADIGAAALGLWQRGEERAALSLLYRGALSRLAHGHGVPIRAASTESECLALAAPRLRPAPQAFLAQLVGAWQTVAYARRQVPGDAIEALCRGFDEHLPASGVQA